MILAIAALASLVTVADPNSTTHEELIESSWLTAPGGTQDSGGASGFEFSYTFVQFGFGQFDIDGFDDESRTLLGRASLGFLDFLYVFLDYENQSTDFNNTDTDMWGLGVGAHFDTSERLNLVGELSWLTADVSSDLATLDDSNDGWEGFAGARYLALPVKDGGLEVNGGFRWISIDGVFSDDEIGAWEVGGRYHFGKLISAGLVYQFLEDDGFYGIDLRLSF
jgi:hypothetical protein